MPPQKEMVTDGLLICMGMARRPEMTEDAFMIIVCHEIGHHLAGMPQYDEWAAIEGQADFFATHACAKNMWRDERNKNAEFSESVLAIAKDKCDSYYPLRVIEISATELLLLAKRLHLF